MTQNRWWTLAVLGALAVVGMYTAVRSAAGVDACGNPCTSSGCCAVPAPAEAKPALFQPPKQHFRFVLDNLTFRMGGEGECKIKRIEFEYKGDGIEADVAKTALTAGNAESSATKAELGELTKLLERLIEAQTGQKVVKPTCSMPPTPAGVCYPSPVPCTMPYCVPLPSSCPVHGSASCGPANPVNVEPSKPKKPEEKPGSTEETEDGCDY